MFLIGLEMYHEHRVLLIAIRPFDGETLWGY